MNNSLKNPITKKNLSKLLSRKPDVHKGQSGHVLIIAGSENYAGSAILSSVSALRVGADLVTLASPKEVGISANCYCPDLITIKLSGKFLTEKHYSDIIKNIKKYDCILIGNGIGTNPSTKKLVLKLLSHKDIKQKLKVIDADAIKFININNIQNSIITPHQSEFNYLLRNSKLKDFSDRDLCKYIGNNIILLKGRIDKIITSSGIYLNKTGNPGMAKAGTGDVLAGLCAGILAKTKSLKNSALAAAYLSGYLGDILLKKKKGYYYIASDLINEINDIVKKIK